MLFYFVTNIFLPDITIKPLSRKPRFRKQDKLPSQTTFDAAEDKLFYLTNGARSVIYTGRVALP